MTMNKAEARRTIESLNAVGFQVDRGVRPSVWWREQRDGFEGPQTLAPMFLRGPEKPGSYDNGATYEPLYDQAALDAAVAAMQEKCAKVAEEFLTKGRSPLGRSVAAAIRGA